MNWISNKILEEYQVRKTKKQKTRFIEFIKENIPDAKVEQGGFPDNRNIVVGDVAKAEVVFTAHYDTCAVLPFPNFIMPKNILFSVLYSVLICIPFIVVIMLMNHLLGYITDDFYIHYFVSLFLFIGLFLLVFIFGIPNKHTANDNTSGVVALCELMFSMSSEERSRYAFVFFDNEENGLFGSAYFRKIHKNQMKNKLLINMDCVGDGDNLLIVESKPARGKYGECLRKAFSDNENIKVHFEKSSTTYYPSDQAGFPLGVAIAAVKRSRILGLYMDRIHTKRDTICEEKNIGYLVESLRAFLSVMDKYKK